jgi:hypothetical protein
LSPPLRETTVEQILDILHSQDGQASFGTILVEAYRRGTLAWHRTLRRYLDLLVTGGVLDERKRDVGSVNPQQLYRPTGKKPTVYSGPKILELHGLNWDTPLRGIYPINTDILGLLKSKPLALSGRHRLAASREDCIAHEVRRDADQTTGTLELVTALAATQTLDLPYLLRRSDEQEIGRTVRLLFKKLIQTFTEISQDADGKILLTTRQRFLQILRQYSKQRALDLLETPAKGTRGIRMIESLTPAQIFNATGKQLGITG